MSSDAAVFRFHGEGSEYRLTDKKPNVGDVLKHDGDNWFVASVEEDKDGTAIVTLRPGLTPA